MARAPKVVTSGLGKNPSTPALILASLAGGEKHGYALVKDVEEFAGVHLPPGTLYEALARLESQGLIEALESEDRRRPYRLTGAGAAALAAHLSAQEKVLTTGRRRLNAGWSFALPGVTA